MLPLPEGAGGVAANVASYRRELARRKREVEPEAALPEGGGEGRGLRPRTPATRPRANGRAKARTPDGRKPRQGRLLARTSAESGTVGSPHRCRQRRQGRGGGRSRGWREQGRGGRGGRYRGFGGGAPVHRNHPRALLHKPMQKHERLEVGVAVVIDDQEQVNVVGHDHEVARRERGVEAVHSPPKHPHAFARARQPRPRLALDEAREHGPPPLHAEREEEELPTATGEREAHGSELLRHRRR